MKEQRRFGNHYKNLQRSLKRDHFDNSGSLANLLLQKFINAEEDRYHINLYKSHFVDFRVLKDSDSLFKVITKNLLAANYLEKITTKSEHNGFKPGSKLMKYLLIFASEKSDLEGKLKQAIVLINELEGIAGSECQSKLKDLKRLLGGVNYNV